MDVGHNQPPSLIEFSAQTATDLSDWLKNYPVIETEDAAREGKTLFDRASDCLKDMETERKARGKPHREQIDLIDGEYRSPRTILEKIRTELMGRLDVWRRQEEEKRKQEAHEARQRAEELERKAREAEAREREAQEEARQGVEVDMASVTRDADLSFNRFQSAEREAARAAAAMDVKIAGGFRRALGASRFQKKELVVTDPNKALSAMGWSERLLEALKTDARTFHRAHGHWPDGIHEEKI